MYEVKMPQMGQSVEEAAIVAWLKKEGDSVSQGEPLFTIQTDKAEIECESPVSGVLRKILLAPDITVPVLSVVAFIGAPDEPLPVLSAFGVPPSGGVFLHDLPPEGGTPNIASAPATASANQEIGVPGFVSPRARAKAAELRIDTAGITGTGPGGRVLEADVLARAGQMESVRISPTARRMAQAGGADLSAIEGSGARGKIMKADVAAALNKEQAGTPALPGSVERIPLSPMRRIVAQRMSASKFAAPHYYITVEVDMAAAKVFRGKNSAFKPSFNDLVLCAVIKALRDYPAVNARWAGDAIERVADINLGVAVALPEGLMVPVLKQAQRLSLEAISTQSRDLAEKARTGKLFPDDYAGNTFTVTNLGPYGVDQFTAIINQPDSAILAVGRMTDRVVAIDGGIHIRPIMKLTISSDHRVIDGALAAQFMGRVKEIIESADF